MASLHMITFRCKLPLFERLEAFAETRHIDRTSVLKLAMQYYLNRHRIGTTKSPRRYMSGGGDEK